MKTTTTWIDDEAFDTAKEGFEGSLKVDGNGFNPKALLLSSLSACSGIDVVEILKKMRVPFGKVVIDAEADQTDDHPRVFKTIHLTFHIDAAEDNLDKVKKAVELSLDKYCGVAAMLRKNAPIEYSIKLGSAH